MSAVGVSEPADVEFHVPDAPWVVSKPSATSLEVTLLFFADQVWAEALLPRAQGHRSFYAVSFRKLLKEHRVSGTRTSSFLDNVGVVLVACCQVDFGVRRRGDLTKKFLTYQLQVLEVGPGAAGW